MMWLGVDVVVKRRLSTERINDTQQTTVHASMKISNSSMSSSSSSSSSSSNSSSSSSGGSSSSSSSSRRQQTTVHASMTRSSATA